MKKMNFPLPGGVFIETTAAKVSYAKPRARLSVRARGALSPLNAVLGFDLPTKIGMRSAAGDVEALCLGPDEWTILAPAAAPILAACAEIYPTLPHSLVDISGREVTLEIDGPRATELLTIGCPRDPDSIRPGEGRRTLFGGNTVVLWRDAETRYRMDIWNSFALHLSHLLETGCKELAAEAQ